MAKRKKVPAELRIYELPQGEDVLALMGEKWVQIYGRDVDNLHFHNLLEIGICHYGEGRLVIEDRQYRFSKNMISFIPVNVLHTTESDIGNVGFWEYLFLSPERILEEMHHGKKNAQKELLELINRDGFFICEEDNPAFCMMVRQIFDEVREKKPFYRESVMNMTPVEFVNFIWIKKACELIDNTDLGMEEIAERVGFVTPSTFNRNFRRIMETSPYQWKKRPDNHKGKLIDYKISALKGW